MSLAWLDDHLLDLALARADRALASGALVPLAMDLRIVEEDGIPFHVRHATGLAKKALSRALESGSQSAVPFDPFEPFEPEMFVADVPTNDAPDSTHVVLLNKFPAMRGHVLLVTRRFAPQLGVPTHDDFVAMAQVCRAMNGLLFYNGGRVAGASQEHRHYQLVPDTGPWPIDPLTRTLPFRHRVVRHDFASATSPEQATEILEHAFRAACADLAIDLSGPSMTPLNFLATREWMMVVPRTREHWVAPTGNVSVNALGFAGLLLLRTADLLPPLQEFGLLRMLDTVTRY